MGNKDTGQFSDSLTHGIDLMSNFEHEGLSHCGSILLCIIHTRNNKTARIHIPAMKSVCSVLSLFLVALSYLSFTSSFVPPTGLSSRTVSGPSTTAKFIDMGERERTSITRDSEPEEFFAT